MSQDRRFPVLWQCDRAERRRLEALGCPHSVPWSLVAPHEQQALENHDQALQRLAERGGLSPSELVAVLRGEGLSVALHRDDEEAVPLLLAALSEGGETDGK